MTLAALDTVRKSFTKCYVWKQWRGVWSPSGVVPPPVRPRRALLKEQQAPGRARHSTGSVNTRRMNGQRERAGTRMGLGRALETPPADPQTLLHAPQILKDEGHLQASRRAA